MTTITCPDTCIVCWLDRELEFADDEFKQDAPLEFRVRLMELLGAIDEATGPPTGQPEPHTHLPEPVITATAAAAQFIADYRRG